MEHDHDATYSPEDNKLRMYPGYRLDKEDYLRFKNAGFGWAPRQELFVAPMWTPQREDLLIEFCGEIGDEDKSLVERSEERAERFTDYSEKRANDAETAHSAVKSITDHIPMGQPILVGHHSEKRARKDAERIENGMRKAVKMWETSEYWSYRAKGAIRAAKYKERPDVRARRIKKIEAAKRKSERSQTESKNIITLWENFDNDSKLKRKDGAAMTTLERARIITNYYDHCSRCFTLEDYPREPPVSQYEGSMSLWSALEGIITPEQARDISVPAHERTIKWCDRWINHFENRLIYEKAMLGEQGATDLLKPKPRPKQSPLLNYLAPDGIQIENIYHRGEFSLYTQIKMTKEEYKKAYNKGTKEVENSHRVRTYAKHWNDSNIVFLTDSKVHKKPEPIEEEPPTMPEIRPQTAMYQPPERTKFDDLKDTLREGVKVVSAPQLFPTPPAIAEKMVESADIETGHRVLEPSAGTGNILTAICNNDTATGIVAFEIVQALIEPLKKGFPLSSVFSADFLKWPTPKESLNKFDRVIMNPPFVNGADIKHINHALTFLKPGGRLVSLCANGPRQRSAFMDRAEHWENLPADSFKEQGTRVNVALMVLTP